ncbi:33477_t:CDS:1, partial [Racocetra persica]
SKNKRKLTPTIENDKNKETIKKTPGELLKNSKKVTKELQESRQKTPRKSPKNF